MAIVYDSREVKPGDTFVAIPGFVLDGTRFIPEAMRAGAKTIVAEKKVEVLKDVKLEVVPSARKALAKLAAEFYDFPSRKLKMIGVTGTNGKTTICYLLESILRKAGIKAGLIGTVGAQIGDKIIPTKLTTPESLDLQALLDQMVKEGVTHVVMEASSHSISLKRLWGTEFDIGIFTNLTHDHLDFHGTLESYMLTKKKFFDFLGSGSKKNVTAIINTDDMYGDAMIEDYDGKIVGYSIRNMKYDIKSLKEMEITIYPGTDSFTVGTSLIGEFNAYNILAAWKCAKTLGIDNSVIKEGIESCKVPGRFELIDSGQKFNLIVDFAHSPDSLKKLLQVVRPLTKGKIILLFGCPGDRDREKRAMMGEIAARLADYTFITTDDPHGENPVKIINEIEKGIRASGNQDIRYEKVVDRRQAIEKAIEKAGMFDAAILAGRGHEQFQDFKGKKVALDDREVARCALSGGKTALSV